MAPQSVDVAGAADADAGSRMKVELLVLERVQVEMQPDSCAALELVLRHVMVPSPWTVWPRVELGAERVVDDVFGVLGQGRVVLVLRARIDQNVITE